MLLGVPNKLDVGADRFQRGHKSIIVNGGPKRDGQKSVYRSGLIFMYVSGEMS